MSDLKKLLAVSFSVFLLALSFALVTGKMWHPAEARAQTGLQFVGLSSQLSGNGGNFVALAQDGGLYGFTVNGFQAIGAPEQWSLRGPVYLGSAGTGPVPGATSSVGDLKGRFGARK
jgi:hypothetical protein